VATGVTDITYGGTRRVNFAAYYPYAEAGGTLDVQTDAEHQKAALQPKIDYLYATGMGRITRPEVSLQFAHRMSQVVLNFTAGTGVTDLTQISDLKLGQLVLTGTFDTQTGVAAASTDATASTLDIATESGTFTEDSTASSYRLILLPQEVSELSLSLALGSKTYATTLKVPNLVAGNSVSFDITVNEASLSIRDGSIIAWAETTGGYNTVTYGDITDLDQVQVLDLAMSDGSFARVWDDDEQTLIYNLVNLKNKDKVVGVVYWLSSEGENPTSHDKILAQEHEDCTHGLIVALNNAGNEQIGWLSERIESVYSSFQSQSGSGVNPQETDYASVAIEVTVTFDYSSMYSSYTYSDNFDQLSTAQGYNNTQVLRKYNESNNKVVLINALDDYEETHPAPYKSSGWYIPTMLEYFRWIDCSLISVSTTSISATDETSSQINTISTLLNYMYTSSMFDVSPLCKDDQNLCYWTSSERYISSDITSSGTNYTAYYVIVSTKGTSCTASSGDKYYMERYLRPICAF
jgi:hypothetical protein